MVFKLKKRIRKRYFLFGLCMVSFILPVNAKPVMKEIFQSFKESQKLDKKILKKLRFELSENQNLGGSTQKYLLRSGNNDLWLFKVYPDSKNKRMKVSRCVYLLAQLSGVSTPEVYEINLPVNGKLYNGAIQKFISGGKELSGVKIDELSKTQIRNIQIHQIFDWWLFNKDSSAEHFIIEPKTKEIITIDKDLSLHNMRFVYPEKDFCNDTYYMNFWRMHVNSKINIDFKEVFNLIEHIQSIENNELRKILLPVLDKDELMDKFFLRKKNLRSHFEKFYRNLSMLRGEQFFEMGKVDKKAYSESVLKKIKNIVLEKRQILGNLKGKKAKQNNIIAVSSKDAWGIINELNCFYKAEYLFHIKKVIEKLQRLERGDVNGYEKLAINLYIEEVRRTYIKQDIESFPARKEIILITLNPNQINDRKIFDLEYNFRAIYREKKKPLSEYKKKFVENHENIFLHLDSVLHSVRRNDRAGEPLLKEYKKYTENDPVQLTHEVLYGILLRDLNYLEKINDNTGLKYLGMSLVWSFENEKDEIVKNCNKAISRNKNNFIAYKSYMLLGLIYEYNNQGKRFGEGFRIEKSIVAYKKAVKINRESVKAHLNLGILYLIKEEPDKALHQFKKADKLDSEYGEKHFHFDQIKRKDLYGNKKEYLEAIKMNTLSGRHHYVLGLAYLVKGDKNSAQKHFEKAGEFGYKKGS